MTATSDDLAALIGYVALASIVATLTHDRLDALDLAQPSSTAPKRSVCKIFVSPFNVLVRTLGARWRSATTLGVASGGWYQPALCSCAAPLHLSEGGCTANFLQLFNWGGGKAGLE